MNVTCSKCGAVMKVAGVWERAHGSRKGAGGQMPPGGLQEWGHIKCHNCDTVTTIPNRPIHVDSK